MGRLPWLGARIMPAALLAALGLAMAAPALL
jgi:hypothetical protein